MTDNNQNEDGQNEDHQVEEPTGGPWRVEGRLEWPVATVDEEAEVEALNSAYQMLKTRHKKSMQF